MLLLEDLDGFYQKKLNIWDIAAGIIIKEAGGKLNPINIKKIKNHKIIASSEVIFNRFKPFFKNF